MRKDVEFNGVTLRGWLYLPDEPRGRVPTIVMAHGYSAVKENYLDKYAEVYAAAGLGALVFDNRNFGASDGKPRQHIDPWRQISDYRDAITYASSGVRRWTDKVGPGNDAICSTSDLLPVRCRVDRQKRPRP